MSEYIRPDEWSDTENVQGPPLVRCFADIEAKPVKWLIPGFIPSGEIVVFGGDGGTGKSSFTARLVADLSAGRPTVFELDRGGSLSRKEKRIIIFSSEDSGARIIKPKLTLAKANEENVFFLDAESADFSEIYFGSEAVTEIAKEIKPSVILWDPIQSFLPDGTVMSERGKMRSALDGLSRIGGMFGTTNILVSHTNKGAGNAGRKRLAESSDLWDKSRAVFLFGTSGNDPGEGRFYISHEKSNYGTLQKTLMFDIVAVGMEIQGQTATYGQVSPHSWTVKKDADFVALSSGQAPAKAPIMDEAKRQLLKALEAAGGSMAGEDLKDVALNKYGITLSTYQKARATLSDDGKIRTYKAQGQGGRWTVELVT